VHVSVTAGGQQSVRYDVEYRSGLRGSTIYLPRSPAPKPAVLLLHGSEGGFAGWSRVWALALAQAGFVTLPWSYSKGGSPWCAGDILEVPLDETEEALAWLQTAPGLSGRLGLYGESRGAEHGLLLTALMARDSPGLPHALAAHGASDTIVGAFIASAFRPDAAAKAARRGPWEGTPILLDPKCAWCWRGTSKQLLPGSPIEIERYGGPLFLSHGEKDDVWSVNRTKRLEKRLGDAGRRPEVHYYPEQTHRLTPEGRKVHQTRLVAFFRRYL
jgi:dipeptidyl aminopeptidase/acylaminoacyl peptidase